MDSLPFLEEYIHLSNSLRASKPPILLSNSRSINWGAICLVNGNEKNLYQRFSSLIFPSNCHISFRPHFLRILSPHPPRYSLPKVSISGKIFLVLHILYEIFLLSLLILFNMYIQYLMNFVIQEKKCLKSSYELGAVHKWCHAPKGDGVCQKSDFYWQGGRGVTPIFFLHEKGGGGLWKKKWALVWR